MCFIYTGRSTSVHQTISADRLQLRIVRHYDRGIRKYCWRVNRHLCQSGGMVTLYIYKYNDISIEVRLKHQNCSSLGYDRGVRQNCWRVNRHMHICQSGGMVTFYIYKSNDISIDTIVTQQNCSSLCQGGFASIAGGLIAIFVNLGVG